MEEQEKPKAAPADGGDLKSALRAHLLPALAIAAFCFLIYGNTFNAPFIFDDQINITDNPYIRVTELSAKRLTLAAVQDKNQLRFLSNLSFGLDYYFHGLDRRWMHAENILIHVLAAVLIYFIVFNLVPLVTAEPPSAGRRRAASLAAALVWATQPAHTQAVTYLVQRQTELCAAAMLASFLAYLRARQAKGRGRRAALYALCLAAFILAAGSKENGWTLPAYLALFEFLVMRRGKLGKKGMSVAITLIVAALLAAFAAFTVLVKTGILNTYLEKYAPLGYGPGQRLLTEARVFASYLGTMFFPSPSRLALDHEVMVSHSLLDPWTTLPALLLVAGVICAVAVCWRRRPLISFLGLGLLLALAPESSIIPVDLMNDHRLYLAAMFVLPPAAAALALVLAPRRAYPLLGLCIVLAGVLTLTRNRTWSSPTGVWADAARKSPGLFRPWANLCGELNEARLYDRALTACDLALARGPDGAQPFINKAIALLHLERGDEAGVFFARAAANYGNDAGAQYNLGVFLDTRGRTEEAVKYYRHALELDKFHLRARIALTRDLRWENEEEDALKTIALATALFPDSVDAWLEMARTDIWAHKSAAAVAAASQAFALAPGPEPLLLLGAAYMLEGKNDEAERAFRSIIALEPMNQRAWMGLIRVDLNRGDVEAAARAAAQVRRSGPLSDEVEQELGELEKQISSRSGPSAP